MELFPNIIRQMQFLVFLPLTDAQIKGAQLGQLVVIVLLLVSLSHVIQSKISLTFSERASGAKKNRKHYHVL